MSKPNPTFSHFSHQLVVYILQYHSLIPRTYTINVFHLHWKQKIGLNWDIQLIIQIWRLTYGQWIHISKIKHAREALEYHVKELILEANITDEHERGKYALPDLYTQYFGTPLSIILDTLIMARKLVRTNQDHQINERHRQIHFLLIIQTSPHMARYPINTLIIPTNLTIHRNFPPL